MITYAHEARAVIWLLRRCWMAVLRREYTPVSFSAQCEKKPGAPGIIDASLLISNFSSDEILALIRLQQHYQNGSSDRAEIVRHLEFMKLMIAWRKPES